ncbi:binding-protein-dependent transport systems inner membrane component [Methanohalobium evestigatum Z-7303]|uniref:Binding-protein-dependent transport systems inner membrane component n=1 Tax=Methanohalobium evestigatum (strain ATCC BAA-1072 / DSM 3721 / NBRC 107634 / OCM 161 / Z-7303) TaxID=644295 RepID=D7EBJ7_METEZ|nr:ABC transporter permease [Methanohalobium evestigatum]ADI74839.1 binding-protein-dependent transport systems inner membrane component [Methanohalobium evestigatum Z-7303]
MKLKEVAQKNAPEITSLIVAVTLWQIVAEYIIRRELLLPSFFDVVTSFISTVESGTLFIDFSISLMHFGIGVIAALLIGIPVGIVMGWFKTVNRISDPIIEILRPIPPLAWIPFALVWLGLTHTAAGFVIFVGAVFPIIINTYTGFKSVPKINVEAAKVLGCVKQRSLIRHIAFPSSLPSITAGIRIGMGVGWMCLVAAEFFGVSKNGLGYKLWWHYGLHQMDFVLMYMFMLGILGLIIDKVFRKYIDKRLLKWQSGVVV